ncbi:MAG: phosphoenolpyruvate--protein phosphotransferase [Gemmatimonadetes bacterium]|nr:phosphoenolpyruvate--protein phosphotransferase [Gemmatimonadota bacterium]
MQGELTVGRICEGLPISEGIAIGPVLQVRWGVPEVPHETVPESRVDEEVERFHAARAWAAERLEGVRDRTAKRLGAMEARIFDPQLLMLDDVEVVEGTVRYIRENHLTAPRAFEWRMLELQARWMRTSNPMVLDRLNDLEDLLVRVLHRLLDLPEPGDLTGDGAGAIVVARNLTPSLTVQMDHSRVLGIATDLGTRTSHWAILARSMDIPAVGGLVDISRRIVGNEDAIVDGRVGRVILDPSERERAVFVERKVRIRAWEDGLPELARLDPVTLDGQPIALRANLDLPGEAVRARDHGAEGVGLFRTEFLVVGRSSMPEEEEQYESYRQVLAVFPRQPVFIRTYDLGGDKFPMFLHMPAEENPFLGWRAIRVCLDNLDLFRPQLRAVLRATAHGDVRILLPLVNDVEEVVRVRELLAEEEEHLRREGQPFSPGYKLGCLVETPAAALHAVELARHCDFFSLGTNDLVQYTLAVDRTNARLAHLYNAFHPAVIRQLHLVSRVGRAAGIEVSACGEMASDPLGTFLLLGLGITALSVSWPSLPEVKKVIRSVRIEDARAAARKALAAPTPRDVIRALANGIGEAVDLSGFSGRWSQSLT